MSEANQICSFDTPPEGGIYGERWEWVRGCLEFKYSNRAENEFYEI